MEYVQIRTRTDLKAEIFRLEELSKIQGETIRSHFSSPGAIFSTIFSFFRPSGEQDEKNGGVFSQDFVGLISRFILPLTLNKTIFRNSNFIIKALVGLVSQKTSHYITEDSVSNVWHKIVAAFDGHSGSIVDKVSSLFEKKRTKRPVNHPAHATARANTIKADQ